MVFFFLQLLLIAPLFAAAQNAQDAMNVMVVCMPGTCMLGHSNIAFGAKLISPISPVPVHLLLGQYTMSTNPQLLHDALSSSPTLTSSAGLPDSLSLPFDLSLQPGLAIFSEPLYAGQTSFTSLSDVPQNSNSSLPLTLKSFALSSGMVAILNSSRERVVIWDPVPDTQHLPLPLSQLSLVGLQSSACNPPCSSGGICSTEGQCECSDGFNGTSCEDCAPGRFGSTCQKCEDQCEECDEGISGTGRCLKRNSGGGNTCDCLNGICGPDGQCLCNDGFVKADNGTQCAKCSEGFFHTSNGDCKVCQDGCERCAPDTGECLTCRPNLEKDPQDPTNCIQPKTANRPKNPDSETQAVCPLRSFLLDGSCAPCDPSCASCNSGEPDGCTTCAQGFYMHVGLCLKANGDGVCERTSLIANNAKRSCDTCGAKCRTCKIPNFNANSAVDQLQCTQCIPGTFLSDGKCINGCPDGTLISSRDNTTCQPCDPSCSTCVNLPTFCLSCSGPGQIVANGKCVTAASCPKNTFTSPSTSSCVSCHPDCATCIGSRFNECASCPPSRPVLSGGRCLPTCAKNEFWDGGANSCRPCDSSCGTCSGPDPSNCLSCSNASDRILRSGSCVPASGTCTSGAPVVSPLGVCLSELVLPQASGTSIPAPMPTVTGINKPTEIPEKKPKRLMWWQILLMTLGGVFVLLLFAQCWRRCARRRREQRRRLQAHAFANISRSARWWGLPEKEGYEPNQVYGGGGSGSGIVEPPEVVILPAGGSKDDRDASGDTINQVVSLYEIPDLKAPPATKGNSPYHGVYSGAGKGYSSEKMGPYYGYQQDDGYNPPSW